MKEYVKYTREQIDSDSAQNIVLELAARAMAHGNRIIIEQDEKPGEKYLMVDFMPTDNSNREYEYDGLHVCQISSVDNDSETGEGEFFSEHRNYIDAINEVCRILRENEWHTIYTESY